jgi:hypothetical protein
LRSGFRFYRAEPVPDRWGDARWPDDYFGGRWGPPYALLQGSLSPAPQARIQLSTAFNDKEQGAHPVRA